MEANHKTLSREERNKLEGVKDHICTNLKERLTVEKLAEKFMFSKSTLRRQFTIFFKLPISEFVFQTRMTKAYLLIKAKDKPVSVVGSYVGYKDRSAFTNAFTKHFGIPPIELFNANPCDDFIEPNEPENHKNGLENHKNEPNAHD
ncbi:helix-turn-helix domain-containing protein [Mucilaginibacter sp.]